MSKATFTLAYDGPALRNGAMEVRDLAPALLALGQLMDAANSVLNDDNARVKVNVTATQPGSFMITFEVIQSLADHLMALLSGPQVTAAVNLQNLLLGSGGLIALVKFLKGRPPEKIERVKDDHVRITIGTESIQVPFALLRLFQNIAVRSALQKLVEEPLRKDGIDRFEVRENKKTIVGVDKKEAADFIKPQVPDEIINEQTTKQAYSIVSLAFKEDNKWRLHDGSNQITASISDEAFLQKVDANQVSFSKGDILICEVSLVQKQTDQGLRSEYTVTKVVEHKPAARQLPLPLAEEESD